MELKTAVELEVIQKPIYPKGMTSVMNPANGWANTTKPNVIGSLSEMYKQFVKDIKKADSFRKLVTEWRKFYTKKCPGRFEQSAKDYIAYFRRELDWAHIPDSILTAFLEDLMFRQTAEGFHIQELVLNKLVDETKAKSFRQSFRHEESKGKDICLNDVWFSVKPNTYKEKRKLLQECIDVEFIFYKVKNKERGSKEKEIVFSVDDVILNEIKAKNED